jgi:DNA-binding CsgD family transcriptional regulator
VKKVRPTHSPVEQQESEMSAASHFVFCDKTTGIAQFRAESAPDRNSTVERIAGMLAMQCLVRGHDPEDFVILVPAEEHMVGRFLSRAKELLEEGRAASKPTALSPRQSEILLSVIRNRANKEIASKLNITVRTVKFHISSLLNKFGVDNRAELARRAASFLKPDAVDDEGLAFRAPLPLNEHRHLRPMAVDSNPGSSDTNRNVRFTRRQLTA